MLFDRRGVHGIVVHVIIRKENRRKAVFLHLSISNKTPPYGIGFSENDAYGGIYMENKETAALPMPESLTVPYVEQSVTCDVSEDFSLPDYYPEVRRVVSTSCRVLPETRFDSGDALEIGGTVSFTVLYLGDDGTLASAPVTCDYEATVPLPKGSAAGANVYTDTYAETATCRATGPRRLSLRARLRTMATGDAGMSVAYTVTDTGGDPASPAERMTVQVKDTTVRTLRRTAGKLTGSTVGEIKERAGTKPVMCGGYVSVNDAVRSESGVTVRGEVVVNCLCQDPDGIYFKAVGRAPIEDIVPADVQEIPKGYARAWGRAASVTVHEGDDGTLAWEAEYDLECELSGNADVTAADDMYSTGYESKAVRTGADVLSLAACTGGRVTVTHTAKRSTPVNPGEYIVYTDGEAKVESVSCTASKVTVSGYTTLCAVICGGGDAAEESVRVPFSYECENVTSCACEPKWRADAEVTEVSARAEGDKLTVGCDVHVSVCAVCKTPVSIVTSLELDRSAKRIDDGSIKIYYPEPGESAWEIAKKYGIRPSDVGDASECVVIAR